MRAFQDDLGRTWEVTIDFAVVQRVKGLTGLNVLTLVESDARPLAELMADPLALFDVIYAICKPAAEGAGVSYDDFGRGFRADAIERATAAFHDEYADFFPQPLIRAGLRKMAEARGRLHARATEQGMANLAAIDLERLVSESIASSGGGPASSASTPGPSPSASSP